MLVVPNVDFTKFAVWSYKNQVVFTIEAGSPTGRQEVSLRTAAVPTPDPSWDSWKRWKCELIFPRFLPDVVFFKFSLIISECSEYLNHFEPFRSGNVTIFFTSLKSHLLTAAHLQPFHHASDHLPTPSPSVRSGPITVWHVVKGLVRAQSDRIPPLVSPRLTGGNK